MSFCCVCYDAGPNKSFDIQKDDPKYLTTIDILKKVNPDFNDKDNERDISSFIWHRTTRCATILKDSECPLKNYPSLVLSKRPELYESLPESLQVYTSLASTEIINGHPGYSIFYFDVKHTTGHNIPRIYLPVMTKVMSRNAHELYNIINESFATLGSVETKAIYKGNGDAFTQLSSVQAVFDELQQLDANQKGIENNKKKNKDDLEAAAKKNVTAEVEFSEGAQQKLAQRSSLSEEVLATEKQYLECLNTIDQFWSPKLKEDSLLTDEEHDYIFKDIKTIMSSHQAFCAALEKVENGYASEFGRLFLSYAPFFKISADYISKYSLINKMLDKKAQESEDFSQKINDLAKEASQNKALPNDLAGYLIQPVKRFSYYSTFLKNIVKVTPKNHPDALFLPLAKKEISDFITQVEEKADSTTKNAILMNIQMSNSDGFDYVTPQRKLTQSFPVSYISNPSLSTNSTKQNNELNEKQGLFHVCNDYAFLVDQETSKCIYKSPLLQFHYLNSPEQNKITVSTIKDGNNADEYITKSHDVQFQNEEDQNNFFSLIEPQAEQKAESTTLPNRSFLWKAVKTNTQLNPVSDHASVFNGNEHVFYGGCGNGEDEYYSDFVLYNDGNVNEVQSGIKGRKLHTFTNVNNKLFVIGGETASGQKSSKIFVYDGEHKGWTAVECPELSQQSCHTAAPNGKDEIIVYGGIPSFGEIYSINTNTYEVKKLPIEDNQSQDQKKIPENRYGHSAVVYNNKMIIYGGRSTEADEILSDLWSFDLTKNKWSLIKWDLLPRSSHTALVIGDEMVVIGGEGSNQSFSVNLNDYNVKFIEEYGNLPSTLIGSSVSYDPTTKNIVVYGGRESHGGPSTSALYELKMSNDWKDSISDNQEVVERDVVSDLNPNFIEVDENGSVKEAPNPEEENDIMNDDEEEVELEIDVELGEEDGTEDVEGNENDVVEDFNISDDKDEEDIEGGDNQNANGYSNDMNFDEIIDDIKEDEKNDEKLDEELRDFDDVNSNQDQDQEQQGGDAEEDVQERDQEQDDNKLSTEPLEEEELDEDKDLNLDIDEEEEEKSEQAAPEKNPWELASDDIEDGLSDDQNNINQFEPDEDKGNQNGEEDENEGNQFEPDEDKENQSGAEEDENEGNQFEPDEDKENQDDNEEEEGESNQFEPDLDEDEEEEDEAETNQFPPDSNNTDNPLSDSELETPADEFDNNEINDFIEGVDEAEEKLDEAQKIQDSHKSNENTENNISSDLGTDNLSEDLGKSDDLTNEKLSTDSEEEEEANENNSENKNQDENETGSNHWKIEESNHFETSDKDDQKASSSHHHHHHSSSSPSRGHHHHHSSSHGHSHSRHHSSRRDSSDYLHSESSSHGRESDHGRNHGNNNNNNNNYDNGMDDSNNSSSTDDLFNSSEHSHSSSSFGGGGGGSHSPSFGVKKPKISKEKRKELERRKNLMNDQSSSGMSSSYSPTSHRKPHRNGGKSDLSFDDSEGSDDSAAPTFSMKEQSKEKYRFTTFSLQKTNCSYLQQNDNSSSYGGYQSPGFSQRNNNYGSSSPRTGEFGSSPRSNNYGSGSSPKSNTYGSGSSPRSNNYGLGSSSKSNTYGSGAGSSARMSPYGGSNAGSGAGSYYSPSRPRNSSNKGSSSYFNSSSSTSNAAPPSFALSPRRRPNFDLESSDAFNDDDDNNFGGGGFSSPKRNTNKYSNYSGSSSANRSGKNKQFFYPSDFINDSPFSKKNRSNDPLYATSPSSRYGARRNDDE